jgi:methylated-DNA-[protein]-cysteine S-methyltransferase
MTPAATTDIITTSVASPVGQLTLTASDGLLTGVAMDGQRHAPPPPSDRQRDDDWFASIAQQLEEYFGGGRTRFDVPLRLSGTEFQQQVWSALRDIPYGETISYGELARRVGNPAAVRAVGLANGRNPVAIIVPCHRVIGADGSLTGYGGGLERKAWLLDLEAAHRPAG